MVAPSPSKAPDGKDVEEIKKRAKRREPYDSYVPFNFIKQQHPDHLLEFYERQVGLDYFPSLTGKKTYKKTFAAN